MSTARFRRDNGTSLSNAYAATAQKLMQAGKVDDVDTMMGFERYVPPQYSGKVDPNRLEQVPGRIGWLVNMHPTLLSEEVMNGSHNGSSSPAGGVAGVDFYFLDEEGGSFKSSIVYDPYFFIAVTDDQRINDVEEYLKKYLETCLKGIEVIQKEDLKLDNHLLGLKKTLIKLSFVNSNQLFEARKLLRPILAENESNKLQRNIYKNSNTSNGKGNLGTNVNRFASTTVDKKDVKTYIEDIREYDVPYHVRVSIDKDIRVGKWYKVTHEGFFECIEKVAFADPVVLAFDIETTKAPLKFPEASVDQVMMISYMIDGDGYLITNREIIAEDIEDFEYTPKPELQGHFTIFNEADELAVLQRFFEHIRDVRPTVISTFNGDFFDWPFIEKRANIRGLDMFEEIGFAPDAEGEYKSSYCVHMDCYRWVKRDSYLPQGSQGLKAVTQAKLGYNPIELDPELMTPYAYEKPQQLSEYSVSDAVATYYLYMKYVHPFIFSLCTIIPLNPDAVLRKGTGTLCEMLLMVQAYKGNILLPNKHTDPLERFYDGHLLESETYVGGHVESLEAGVFRSDLENDFKIDPSAIDELIDDLPNALKFAVEVENKAKMEEVTNFDEIKDEIKNQLLELKMNNKRCEVPLIYHVDVASMYPNIMTTNRLQPDSIKDERDCASCDFNRPGKTCARRLKWAWRGEFYPAKADEYNMIKRALQNETFPNKNKFSKKPFLTFDELSYADQVMHIKKRLTEYSKKNYHRVKVSEVVEREAIVCQRENPFYVDTVKSFRDRRYEFKGLAKTWKGKMSSIDKSDKHAQDEAKKMIVLYDSLQLAHKVILNSFYGYVMRKGSRWYSMEMAGITCLTGATIIQMARALVERVGRPLELDTDGIWCILPKSFPENFLLKLQNGKKLFVSYPCTMLNYRVHQKFTNHQYQELVDPIKHKYETHSENTIFFEVDGPYKAMILPTSKEEGKGIKKRYAVFNDDGSLAELKGFELKRRGELQLIKNFQSDIFKVFLDGDTLESCYGAVAAVSNRWLDILDNKGSMLEDEDLVELICENRSMSKSLKEYEGQKSTSITTAKRLGEFLGDDMVKDKGLQCKYIISSKPHNAPVTERAIPVAIFSADINIKRSYLRRWTMDHTLDNFDIRTILDWGYYRERLASVVQKIITIPAALQNIPNPVPRVAHPDWLKKKILIKEDKFKQTNLEKFFNKTDSETERPKIKDIEDLFEQQDDDLKKIKLAKVTSRKAKNKRHRYNRDEEVESLVLPSIIPSMENDYANWLEYQKIKWKIQRRDRNRRMQLFGKSSTSNNRSVLGSMIRKQAEVFANTTWEVLQYKDNYESGAVDAFVLINGKIQVLKFYVPRTVFINFKTDSVPLRKIKNCQVEKSNAVLPNDSRINNEYASHLFKLQLPEQSYIEELEDSSSVLNDENVLGIYEGNITPSQRALMELGTTVIFKSKKIGSLGKGLQEGFAMKDLSGTSNDRYMSHFDMNVCYLLHIVTNVEYEIYALVSSWTNTISVFVKKPSFTAQDISESTISNIFSYQYEKKSERIKQFSKYFNISEDTSINCSHFVDTEKLMKNVNKEFSKIKEEKGQQFILLLQSPYPSILKNKLKITNQVPIIDLSINELSLPKLNWQQLLMNRMCSYFLSIGYWVSHIVTLSQNCNIPLGNINLEKIDFALDIIYARRLKNENIVLWWNDKSPLSDHGGVEKDFDLNSSWILNDLDFLVVNTPDVYENVVLDISIENLVVNTILCSALINEAEGSDLADNRDDNGSGKSSNGFVKDSFSTDALSVLRTMLKEWWDRALQNNVTADLLVNSLVSWVYSPVSKLFDASLRYHIHNLTKKSLYQLMNEFNELGSVIVYADRNKLLVETTKFSPETCYAYSHYTIKSIRSNPMFTYLDLSIERYWDLLIWMDRFNFSGLSCNQIEEKEEQEYVAYSQWQIKNFLPTIYQSEFEDWIMIILDSMVKAKRNYLEESMGTQRATQLITGTATKENYPEEAFPLAHFTTEFAKPLIKRINKLFRNQQEFILDPHYAEDYKFPILPGSHLDMGDPLLELIKCIFQVLLLCKNTTLEVRSLRKEVLKILEIREFAKEAEFKNPADSLIVNGILCEYCSYVSDIDFCRDGLEGKFSCTKCDKPLNELLLQEHLIQKLTTELQAYVTQDLRCAKCHSIKKDYMSTNCTCSGSWVCVITSEKLMDTAKTYRQLSEFYGFELVKDALTSLF
ncbi:DNA polymerase epsilon catalytic subunit [Nakaseomyces bracarensis]|uniref:DNA polymerase epsilon catalytic subunit n=1 Tax=Nakaseomyces bracarensis TaxID=273131 RepID=UPI003871BBCD